MCHFITAVMSPAQNAETVRTLAKAHQLRWEPIRNRCVEKLLRPSEGYYFTTWGMCDCNTEIGSLVGNDCVSPEQQAAAKEKAIRKLHKKGWSQAKIDRQMHQQELRSQRLQAEADRKKSQPGDEVRRWLGFFNKAAETRLVSSIGLLKHFYNADLDSESIEITERGPIRIDDISPDVLMNMEDDTLYRFDLRIPNKK